MAKGPKNQSQKSLGPKKFSNAQRQKGNQWYAPSRDYIMSHNVEFPSEDFEVIPPRQMFKKKESSRREDSMNLHGNMDHVLHVRHKKSATEFYICYIARLVLVKRFTGKMRTVLPSGFQRNKLTSRALYSDEAFAPLLRYLPDFIKEDNRSKNARETFSSLFAVYCKKPSRAGPTSDGATDSTTDGTPEDDNQSRRGSITPASSDTELTVDLADTEQYSSEYHSEYFSPPMLSPGYYPPQEFGDPVYLYFQVPLRDDPFLPAVNDS